MVVDGESELKKSNKDISGCVLLNDPEQNEGAIVRSKRVR